jgi:hypothetical protein
MSVIDVTPARIGSDEVPDLHLVSAVHRALVEDAERFPNVAGDLSLWDRADRTRALQRYFAAYDEQVQLHQAAVRQCYVPALRNHVGRSPAVDHVEGQHLQLDDAMHRMRTALQAAADDRVELVPAKARLVEAATTLARHVRTTTEVEELVLLPLYRQHVSGVEHRRIQLAVRANATFAQLEFLVPWLYDRVPARRRHEELAQCSELFRVLFRTRTPAYRALAEALDVPAWAR